MANILLTGPPRIGKTTLIMKVLEKLGKEDANAGGFYTEEIRRGGIRVGFRIISLDGGEGILSHVDYESGFGVGRYNVNLTDLEAVGVKSIRDSLGEDLIVIDEIGKMELLSLKFRDAVLLALDTGKVLGTIKLSQDEFTREIRRRKDTEIIEVTFQNRDSLASKLAEKIKGRG